MPEVPGGAPSRRLVVGTMAVSAAGPALPAAPWPPTQTAYADEAGDRPGPQAAGLAVVMARMAALIGAEGEQGGAGATQAAQALALDEGLVPDGERRKVLDALVELVRAHQPFGAGLHLSGGTSGLAPIVRALHQGGRDDVLWGVLQEDTRPGYGSFMAPTTANPHGPTTVPEQWDMGNSKNHMILLQIDEWFHSGLAAIRQARGKADCRELVMTLARSVDSRMSTAATAPRAEWCPPGGSVRTAGSGSTSSSRPTPGRKFGYPPVDGQPK